MIDGIDKTKSSKLLSQFDFVHMRKPLTASLAKPFPSTETYQFEVIIFQHGERQGLSGLLRWFGHQLHPKISPCESYRVLNACPSAQHRLTVLQDEGYEVICFMADVGQEEDFQAAKQKALKIGANECYIEDLRREVSS